MECITSDLNVSLISLKNRSDNHVKKKCEILINPPKKTNAIIIFFIC